MKSLKHLIVVASFAALAVTGIHAQSLNVLAEVPFDFHAGNKIMPAGEYVVYGQGPVIWLRGTSDGGPISALMTFTTANRYGSSRGTHLEFNRYGSQYFLTEVWSSFSGSGRQVPQTARQKELAKRGDPPVQTEIILASK